MNGLSVLSVSRDSEGYASHLSSKGQYVSGLVLFRAFERNTNHLNLMNSNFLSLRERVFNLKALRTRLHLKGEGLIS